MWRRVLRIARCVRFVKAPLPEAGAHGDDHHTRPEPKSKAGVTGTPKGDHPCG